MVKLTKTLQYVLYNYFNYNTKKYKISVGIQTYFCIVKRKY